MGNQTELFCLAETKVVTSLAIHRVAFWTEIAIKHNSDYKKRTQSIELKTIKILQESVR